MIPLLLSVTFGVAIYLLYEGLTNARPATSAEPRLARRLKPLLIQAGLGEVIPRDMLLISLAAGVVCGVVAQLFLGWVVVSVLAAGLAGTLPIVYIVHRRDRRRAAVQRALVEATGQLRDAIRTGLSVPEALVGLARSGPEVLRAEFLTLVRELRLIGFEPAVMAMRERLADPVFDMVAASLVLNDRLGGRNISQVLDRLVYATRAQLRIQDELRAYQARTVASARIVAAVPVVVLIGIRMVNPDYLAIFNDAVGQLLLAGSVVSVTAGYAAMLRLARLPDEPRVLS